MKLVIADQALQDLYDIEAYISKDNPRAAIQFVGKLYEHFMLLQDSPRIGSKREEFSPGFEEFKRRQLLDLLSTRQ